jgi:DNA polymerase III subunit beta
VDVACTQEQLQRALALVSRAVAAKTSLPILSNVLVGAEGDRVRIAATNLEIGITTWIDADVQEEGLVSVDARLLADFVNTLPAGSVRLRAERGKFALQVQSGEGRHATKAGINGVDPDDFPVLRSEADGAFAATVDPQILREMIGQVEFAAATDESRPVLAGVLARFEGAGLTLAAADGFRLAVRTGPLAEPVTERLDAIVPARAMRELGRILGDHADPVALTIAPNRSQLMVRVDDTEFVSRLIEGTFPDYRAIVPREFNTSVTVGRDALLTAVRRASFFARDNNDVVRMLVSEGEADGEMGAVEVSATAAERGSSQSFVDAGVRGPETQIAFNARYLVDVLGVLRHGSVMMGMNGPNQAGVIRAADADDYDHVIMPMVIGAS